jgi:hypothetical protein
MANCEYDAQSVISAAPSITSISSLASLLKEKMQVSFLKDFLFCKLIFIENPTIPPPLPGPPVDDPQAEEAERLQNSHFRGDAVPHYRLSSEHSSSILSSIF